MQTQAARKKQRPQVNVSLEKAEEMPLKISEDLARNIKTRGQLEQEAYEAEQERLRQLEHERKRQDSEKFVTAIKWTLVIGAVAGLGYMTYFYSPKIFKHAATGVEIILEQ